MIIFRKLINSKLKLFVENVRSEEIKYLVRCSRTTTMEFLKAIEMYYLDSQDVDHWIDKAVGYILNMSNKDNVSPYMSFVCLLDNETIENLIGSDGLKYMSEYYKANSQSDILNLIKKSVKFKYANIEKSANVTLFNDKDDYYFKVIKFVTLCLCGLTKPENWDNTSSWINKKIPDLNTYNKINKNKKFTSQELHELLKDCVEYILYVKQN